jgi:hypothetical protein
VTAAAEIVRRDPASFNSGSGRAVISQATAIEQSRAIAEVQAAVVVAQNCPRSMTDAEAEMEYVCGRLDMAEQAFYQVTNRGTGPSVHLARELARIWGNVDYGVKELHRSDDNRESEILAYSWDVQKNTRSSRTFIVPHQRMKAGLRVDLTDLQDIYLNNQNIGARAVRETIFTILPRWFTEKAQNICHTTLEHGEGEPLQDRIAKMVSWFADSFGISVGQLETRVGKPRGQWDPSDVAQFKIAGQSIQRGEAQQAELFPPASNASTTADEIATASDEQKPKRQRKPKAQTAREELEAQAVTDAVKADQAEGNSLTTPPAETVEPPSPDEPEPAEEQPVKTGMRRALEKRLFVLLKETEVTERADRLAIYRAILKRPDVNSTNDLDDTAVARVADQLFQWGQDGRLDAEVTEIINAATLAAENQETQS